MFNACLNIIEPGYLYLTNKQDKKNSYGLISVM